MNLLPEENQIMENKYASPCFVNIPTEDRFLLAKTLLLKIHIITGWTIPEEQMMVILIDQFLKKMVESYPTVNSEEMEYAFRNNPGVKDWGKAMNLNLIDEVMTPYLEKRKELSRMEEEKKMKLLELPAPEISDEDFIESIKNLYEKTNDWRIIPVLAYDILDREKKIKLSKEDKYSILNDMATAFPESTDQERISYSKSFSVKLYFDELKSI
jgi:hypothetical protein